MNSDQNEVIRRWVEIVDDHFFQSSNNEIIGNLSFEEAVMAAVGTQLRAPSSNNGNTSRLSLMQAKFRQQLMIEKESRLLEMAARQDAERQDIINRVTKTSASSSLSSSMSSLGSTGVGPGRVRKMFEERRHNPQALIHNTKGFDKSYPLDPVKKDLGRPPVRGVRNGRGISVDRVKAQRTNQLYEPTINRSRSQAPIHRVNRGDTRQQKPPKGPTGRGLPNHHKSTSSLVEGSNIYRNRSRGPSPGPPSSTKSSPGPTMEPFKPLRTTKPITKPRLPPSKSENNFLRVNGTNIENTNNSMDTPEKGFFNRLGFGRSKKQNLESTPSNGLSNGKQAPKPKYTVTGKVANGTTSKQAKDSSPAPRAPPPGNLKSCKICGRNFDPDRLDKHQQICAKTKEKAKKRKVFDSTKLRTKGTDAEKYIARGDHLKENKKTKKSNWRKKHEDFIQTIRAAKGMKGYEAPPMDVSDYIQCPHCGRKFSEQVADRHIPKCANITCNKPNKNAPPRRR